MWDLDSGRWHFDHEDENQISCPCFHFRLCCTLYSFLRFIGPSCTTIWVRGIFIEGDKCTLKGDNSWGRSHIVIVPLSLCHPALALFTKLFQIGSHPLHWERWMETGLFCIIWGSRKKWYGWDFCFCHDCCLILLSCMNNIFATWSLSVQLTFFQEEQAQMHDYCHQWEHLQ